MLGSMFSRSKLPLKDSRSFLESIESFTFLLDPSWAFVSCKNNYFWVKKVICHLHTKSALSPLLKNLGQRDVERFFRTR